MPNALLSVMNARECRCSGTAVPNIIDTVQCLPGKTATLLDLAHVSYFYTQ